MNCKEVKATLYDYTKGEVTPETRSVIDSHLPSCASCAAELASIMKVKSIIHQGLHEPGANNLEIIRKAMKRPFEWLLGPKPAVAFAATLLIFSGLIFADNMIDSRNTQLGEFISDSYSVVDNSGNYAPEAPYLEDDLNNEIF
jgi:anti-sigma factor RsiW